MARGMREFYKQMLNRHKNKQQMRLSAKKKKLVNHKHTNFLKQNFSETKIPIDKSCMLLFNLRIDPAVC